MQILKKSFSVLLCFLMVFSLVAVNVSAQTASSADDFTFAVVDDYAKVTAYNGTATEVVIPEQAVIDGVTYPVKAIGERVFAGGDNKIEGTTGDTVTSIVFPENIVIFDNDVCWGNTNLASVTINGNGVTLNKRFASDCSNLTNLTINGSVKALGASALANTGLTTLEFPEGLTAVYDYAFFIASLTTLKLPSTLTSFTGDNILYGNRSVLMNNLTIYVPDTKTEAAVRTGCKATYKETNETEPSVHIYRWKMVVGDGYESDPAYWPGGSGKVTQYTGSATKVVVPAYAYDYSAVNKMGSPFDTGAAVDMIIPECVNLDITCFRDNTVTKLEKLTLNCDVTGANSFRNCTTFKEVIVNGNISGSYLFNGCSALEKATINTISSDVAVENIFIYNPVLTEITLNGVLSDATVTLVHAVSTVPKLTKLVIAETGGFKGANGVANQFKSVSSIISDIEVHGTIDKQNCFYGFAGIKNVKIYKTAKLTQTQIFRACTGLKNIEFEEGTTIASGNCFQGCTGLKKLEIARNVTFTMGATFYQCSNLTTIDLKAGVTSADGAGNLFKDCTSLKHVILRDGAVSISMGNTANTNFVTYYLPTWFDGMSIRNGANSTSPRSCYIDEDVVLTDDGGDYLVPSKNGYIFTDFVTTIDGKEVWFDKENQSQLRNNGTAEVMSFQPKFVRAIGGDVNGDHTVNVKDIVRYKKYLANALGEELYQQTFIKILADIDQDGEYAASDLTVIRQMLFEVDNYSEGINDKYSAFQLDDMLSVSDVDALIDTSVVQDFDELYAYNHHPHITKFGNMFYVIYSQGYENEDDLGQRVMYATSEDGKIWNEPEILSDSCYGELYPEQETVQFPLGFFNNGEKLYAFYVIKEIDPESVSENGAYDYVTVSNVYYYTELVDGEWTEPVKSECSLGSYASAKLINGVYYTTTATGVRYSTDGINWVTRGLTNEQVNTAVANGAVSLSEGTLYMTDNYVLHLFMRGGDGYIWHTSSIDGGLSWSDAYRTALTNDNSKLFVGQLPDGRYYIVSNPVLSDTGARNPLCISISEDGYNFDSSYIIRGGEGEDYELQQPGIAKGGSYAYPACYADGNTLYVVYSCGKEVIEVTSVDLSALV